MANFNFNDFLKLVICSDNVFESWRCWLVEFNLSIEMATMNMGTEAVNNVTVDIFRDRMKLVALLGAIGKEGRTTLQSVRFDFENDTYDQAITASTNVYGVEETVYV